MFESLFVPHTPGVTVAVQKQCKAFYCAYSDAGFKGVLAGVIIGFSFVGCYFVRASKCQTSSF